MQIRIGSIWTVGERKRAADMDCPGKERIVDERSGLAEVDWTGWEDRVDKGHGYIRQEQEYAYRCGLLGLDHPGTAYRSQVAAFFFSREPRNLESI